MPPFQKLVGFQEKVQFEALCRLQPAPLLTRPALAEDLGVGLRIINFCFQALVEKGWVKMQNLGQSKNKLRYFYLLTLVEVLEKSKLTAEFLSKKVTEYQALQTEMTELEAELSASALDQR